ncbi:MAG TPA: SGNH/GDSL hydrolase family protein [Candidatus Nanoarchaeia archaeon]|nr:SGNH/GDSL hydrolase family protein [Candidatus Nanoarchaeia archaeon]
MLKIKKLGINIFISLITIIIVFLIIELFLRVFYPQPLNPEFYPTDTLKSFAEYDKILGWGLRSNAEGYLFSNEYKILVKNNEQGLRMDRNISLEKSKYRIAFMGDSFIFGHGVNTKERVSELIERELSNLEVINFGVSGYGTDQYYLQLQNNVLNFKPDMVIIAFYVNDLEDVGENIRYNYPKPLFRLNENDSLELTNIPVPLIKPKENRYPWLTKINLYLSHKSHTFVFFKPLLKKLYDSINSQKDNEIKMYGFSDISLIKINYSQEYKGFKELNDKLYCEISNLLKQRNIPLIVVNIPAKSYILPELLNKRLKYLNINESEVDINKPSEILYNLSKNCNFYFIDLYSYFKKYKNRENLYFKYDDHWTPEGHQYASKILLKDLKDKIIWKKW